MKNLHPFLLPYYISIISRGNIYNFFVINFVLHTGPFLFTLIVYSFICFDLSKAISLIWLYIFIYLIFFPLYEIGYIVDEYVTIKSGGVGKYLKCCTSKEKEISHYLIIGSLLRLVLFSGLLHLLPLPDKITILWLSILLLATFLCHNFVNIHYRIRTTYPVLQFLKTIFIFMPLTEHSIEKMEMMFYSLSYAFILSVYYIHKKLNQLTKFYETPLIYFSALVANFTILNIIYILLSTYTIGELLIFPISIVAYYAMLKSLKLLSEHLRHFLSMLSKH